MQRDMKYVCIKCDFIMFFKRMCFYILNCVICEYVYRFYNLKVSFQVNYLKQKF